MLKASPDRFLDFFTLLPGSRRGKSKKKSKNSRGGEDFPFPGFQGKGKENRTHREVPLKGFLFPSPSSDGSRGEEGKWKGIESSTQWKSP